MAIKTILFDLDGTLWRPESPPDWDHVTRLQCEAIAPTLGPLGVNGREAIRFVEGVWQLFGPRFQASESEVEETADAIGCGAVIEALAGIGKSCPTGVAGRLWSALMAVPRRHYGIRLVPDAPATLAELAKAGFRMAIVTNNPVPAAVIATDLEHHGLPPIEAIVTSRDVGFRKPDRRIFETALQLLDSAPDEAICVGDSLATDIDGAIALGITPVFVSPDPLPPRPPGVLTISSLHELLSLELLRPSLR